MKIVPEGKSENDSADAEVQHDRADKPNGVLAPMPFLRLMPTGGVTPENVSLWFAAGVVAVGLGSALVDPRLVAAGDFAAITDRARAVSVAVLAARAARSV